MEVQRDTWLGQIRELSGLEPVVLEALEQHLSMRSFRAGERIAAAGEPWEALYIIVSGQVRLVAESRGDGGATLDTLREGAYFGEQFLLAAESSAHFSVYVDQPDTALLVLSDSALREFEEKRPALARLLQRYLDEASLFRALQRSRILGQLSGGEIRELLRKMEIRELEPGEHLIRQGEEGSEVYVVEEGSLEVCRDDRVLHTARKGEIIGETALITDAPRNADVKAVVDSRVLALKKRDFLDLLRRHASLSNAIDGLVDDRRIEGDGMGGLPPRAPASPPSEAADGALEQAPDPVDDHPDEAAPYEARIALAHRLGAYPTVRQQSQMDCGAACLATVCRYYGKRVNLNQMRRLARVGQSGASMLNLVKAADELGFDTTPYLSTYEQLASERLPAIVNWKGYHWIVVFKVTDERVIVADPGGGIVKYPRAKFEEGWTRYTLFLNPTRRIEDIEEAPPTIQGFLKYIRPHTRLLSEILLASITVQVFGVIVPLFSKFVLDEVVAKQESQWLLPAIIALAFLMFGNALISFFRQNLLVHVSKRINTEMVVDFLRHLFILPLSFFERRKVGDITSRLQENRKITEFLTNTGLQTFLNALSVFVYLGLMLYLNVTLTIVSVLFLGLHILNMYVLSPRLRNTFMDVFQKNADSQSHLIESIRGLATIKTLGVQRPTRWTWEDLHTRFLNAYFRTVHLSLGSGVVSGFVNNVSDVAVLFIAAYFVLEGDMTIGGLVAFQMFNSQMTAPAIALVGAWDNFQETLNGIERLNDVHESEPEFIEEEREQKITVPQLRGAVRFDNVTFRYELDAKSNVLQNISLDVAAGQRVAFVGRSGSGKSTLIKLLFGFYKPTSGRILIDGFDLRDLWLPALREQIGVVDQQSFLMRGTVRENISQGKPGAMMPEVIEAARLAAAHDFIEAMPDGYDTMIEEDGRNLSGGQRQRLSIARTFLSKPRLLILDEATSALDNETERFVQRNIESAFGDRTVFMIAHRLSTVRSADLIVVLEKGNILEMGTHDELLENRSLYYYLSTQQLEL